MIEEPRTIKVLIRNVFFDIIIYKRVIYFKRLIYPFCSADFLSSDASCFNKSPGWQFKCLHIASRVENLMAFAFPVFKFDKFCTVIPTASARSFNFISLSASKTLRFTEIGISVSNIKIYTVRRDSSSS